MAAPRAYWKGHLGLSLVSCPIELYPATSEKDKVSFNQLNSKTGNRVKYKKVDTGTGDEVLSDDIIKGFQFEKDNYVTIDKDELDAIALDSNKTVEIVSFVPESEIDGLYYNEPYYIAPPSEDHAEEAFAVIREAMSEKGMVAIGRVVLGSREHMIAIQPRGKGLIRTTLLYPYEVRREKDVFGAIPELKFDREMIDMAHQLMKSKQGHFQPEKFEDRYESALRDLVTKKQKGATLKASAPGKASSNVIDLMAALKASLSDRGASNPRRERPVAERTPAKKAVRSNARTRKAG
jgi:DNA end-binding protein Ku